jgi:Flp pilus assembly pilin Flp
MIRLKNWLKADDGQDVMEYALLASFISVFAIVTIRAVGPLVEPFFTQVQGALTSAP